MRAATIDAETAPAVRSVELLMGGLGDAIAATGFLSALASRHGTIEVHGGGIAELLRFRSYLPIARRSEVHWNL